MEVIKKNVNATQDKQNIYAYQHMILKEVHVGDNVYLCIKPMKNSLRIGSCAKLAPQYCRPFEILERIEPAAY